MPQLIKPQSLGRFLSDICDGEPLTPSRLLYRRTVSFLPFDYGITSDDLTDRNYGDGVSKRRCMRLQTHLVSGRGGNIKTSPVFVNSIARLEKSAIC